MTRDELLEALNDRVPFRIARRLLVASGFPTGHGWDNVTEKLKEADAAAKANDQALLSLYIGALAVAEKRISIYDIGQGAATTLSASMSKQLSDDAASPLSASYPLPLSRSNLDKLKSIEPVVVGKVAYGLGDIFIVSYVKEARFRVAISPSQVNAAGGMKFSEVYGIRVERTQTFDAVILPTSGSRVFLLTDVLANKSQEATRDSVSRVAGFMKSKFKVDLKAKRVNLFPAVAKFYLDAKADVVRLDHTTTDGQAITEFTKGGQRCVRTGDFHKGGMGAVNGGTDAFGIEVAWDVKSSGNIDNRVELSLVGSSSLAFDLNPVLDFALISKAGTLEELAVITQSLDAKV